MPGFDFAFAIGIADATRQRDHAVVREHVAIERIERRIVDVGREHALFEIVEDDDAHGAAEPTKRALVELGPVLRARLPHQQPHRFARVAERQDEEARAPVLAGLRVPHHRPVAVIDLAFFAGRGGDDDARLGRRRAPRSVCDEAPHARIPRGEAVAIDQVLPDRHRVAATPERLDDQLSIRLARARTRRAARARDRAESVDTSALVAGFAGRVGGHLPEMAGFDGRSRWTPPAGIAGFGLDSLGRPRPRTGMPGGFQIAADRFPADAGRLLDARERPAQSARVRRICCCLCWSKTLLMPATEPAFCARVNVSAVSVNCRF